jgi:polyhydroxyalkanoate synthesis regulator phasin
MKAKNLLQLLTLSTNLYMISKDEEFMENLSEMMKKGKEKVNDLIEGFANEGEADHEQLIQKFLHKAKKAKEELERKMSEVAEKVYEKMHIAHSDEVKRLSDEIASIKKELALAEARIVNLEPKS